MEPAVDALEEVDGEGSLTGPVWGITEGVGRVRSSAGVWAPGANLDSVGTGCPDVSVRVARGEVDLGHGQELGSECPGEEVVVGAGDSLSYGVREVGVPWAFGVSLSGFLSGGLLGRVLREEEVEVGVVLQDLWFFFVEGPVDLD